METKEDPVKIKAIIKELREVYLELVDYYLSNALNLNDTRRSSWLKMRDILIGKLEVSTRIEVSFYEDQLISLKDFLKNDEKERKKKQMKRGIATIVNNVPILLTDSDSEDELFSTNENTVKIDRWTAPQSISDISDHTLPIGDNRDNRQDPRFSPLDVEPVEPIINSQIQSSWDQSFVAQINFQERPPEIPPLLRKNTKNNPRISHYQNAPQPHSSSPARAPQDSYRNHRLRKEQAQRLANSRKKSNETESSVNVHRSNEPSISVTPSATLLSNYQENLIAINKEIIINEPVVAAMPLQHLDINDNFFEVEILKKLDDQYNINHKKIKMEVGFEIVLPEEVNIKTEYSEEIINYEPPIDIKSEPVTYFSDVDENTSEFKYNYTAEVVAENVKGSLSEQLRNYTEHRCFKEEPLDI